MSYREHIDAHSGAIDLDFWRRPEGISVPDDELQFLLVPDAVEAAAIAEVAVQLHRHQVGAGADGQITRALIVTMGGMLPGVLLYDHLVEGRAPGLAPVKFGTVGVSLYEGPGVRYDEPRVDEPASIDIAGQSVLLVDDLVDRGGTMLFLKEYVTGLGAREALSLVLYSKPAAAQVCPPDFCFGELEQDTWLITPRERVETLAKRVPVWRERGASLEECRRRLVELIGYPPALVQQYLPQCYKA